VTFQTSVSASTGGHAVTNHDSSNRPKGSFVGWPFDIVTTYTGIDGCAYLTWAAPIFSGFHDILAYASGGGTGHASILVVQDINLVLMAPNTSVYNLVGDKPPHPVNHYGTGGAVSSLQFILSNFKTQTGLIANVNDLSLVYGGKFDFVVSNSSFGCWADIVNVCGHSEHRAGRNADIPFSGLGNQAQRDAFFGLANSVQGGGSSGGPIIVHADHYHLRFGY
jgi:hypothetical protein